MINVFVLIFSIGGNWAVGPATYYQSEYACHHAKSQIESAFSGSGEIRAVCVRSAILPATKVEIKK